MEGVLEKKFICIQDTPYEFSCNFRCHLSATRLVHALLPSQSTLEMETLPIDS